MLIFGLFDWLFELPYSHQLWRLSCTMDPDVAIMYVPSKEKRITRHNLKVELSTSYNRKSLPEPLEAEIGNIWMRRVTDNPTLWNGSKFRIVSVSDNSLDVTFNMGITSYRDFIGTNWSPEAKSLRQLGDHMYSDAQVVVHLSYEWFSTIQWAFTEQLFVVKWYFGHCWCRQESMRTRLLSTSFGYMDEDLHVGP